MLKSLKAQMKTLLTLFVVFALLITTVTPAAALDTSTDLAGQKPLNYVGAYLTEISNNTSTTGADITTVSVPVRPLIKIVVDKNVVDDTIWQNNQNCVAIQNSAGENIQCQISRILSTVNFNERQNIFITPLNDLLTGEKYKIVISPNLLAKNNYSTLGMTTNNQPIVVNFTVEGTAFAAVTGITLNTNAMTITEGKTAALTAAIAPANATNKAVTWTSSNTSVAAVNQNGLVTAAAPGTALITVKTTDGAKTATCTVNVKAAQIIYYVKPGDALYKIAQIYGLTANDLIIANNFTANSYIYVGQAIIIPTIVHVVQSGDYIYKIALKYGATSNAIIIANNLSATGSITIGQKLFVPINLRVYTVKAGDTLWLVAQNNATTISNLVRLNNLDTSKPLYIGQNLKVNY